LQTHEIKLNPNQQVAVSAGLGNLLVLAGAGSGKTRVLIQRISWLVSELGQNPAAILAVTFTNKAASEMRQRLHALLPAHAGMVWVGTFHGLAHKILRTHAAQANLVPNFQIMGSDDQLKLIKKVMKELSMDHTEFDPNDIKNYINRKKDEAISWQQITKVRGYQEEKFIKVYERYEYECNVAGTIDFAEILLRSYRLLSDNPEILKHYRQRFAHFLVDEFQDTNTIQYLWLKALSADSTSMFVVGDDDQSIYGWRGAKIENINKFQQEYPGVAFVRLEQNYRSTKVILDAANAVIQNNTGRLGKNLWTDGQLGQLIDLFSAINEHDEAMYIVRNIESYVKQGRAFKDLAVLYRSNAQSRVIEEALLSRGIPYKIYGGLRFFDRAEVKDILGYLRLAVNHDDNAAFERIINTPPRGLGKKSVDKIVSLAQEQDIPLLAAAGLVVKNKLLTGKAYEGLAEFINIIVSLANMAQDKSLSLSSIVETTVRTSKMLEYYAGKTDLDSQDRIANLQELVNATKDFIFDFQEDYNVIPVVEFLSYTSLDDLSFGQDNDNAVQMMTIHAAKGLEFPIVFICGMEETLFPHQLSSLGDKLEEERRLCYVGITRAETKLHLSHANMRRIFGELNARKPSRFLKEIPTSLLESNGRNIMVRKSFDFDKEQAASEEEIVYRVGLKVNHPRFGPGVVIETDGLADKLRVHIRFINVGTKWLVPSYAKLELLG
jgi:DNA helicase-2/ATP-dependent DNA helicase PcrA